MKRLQRSRSRRGEERRGEVDTESAAGGKPGRGFGQIPAAGREEGGSPLSEA